MKLNKIFSKRTAYIMLFGILYLAVAFTSTLHAIQFFGLTNENISNLLHTEIIPILIKQYKDRLGI